MTSLSCGIVGLPNVGKSTLFRALTRSEAEAANFPFCTIEPNEGIVEVRDPRLELLQRLYKSGKVVYPAMKFTDIAGLVEGASKGEGLGNQFLSAIRESDAILHVVRCFDDDEITHVAGAIDPIRDIGVINLELILSDLSMAQNTKARLEKKGRLDPKIQYQVEVLGRVIDHLNEEKPVRSFPFTEEEAEALKQVNFITAKPILYVANVSENELPTLCNAYVEKVRAYAKEEGAECLAICAKIEDEIAQLDESESMEFLKEMGLEERGLDRLVRASYQLLGLLSFFTAGEMEARGWTVSAGSKAPHAAGRIHTDLQKGFIRAEVISFSDLEKHGSQSAAKEAGRVRLEGKEYTVCDGDVILFHCN